MDKIIEEIEFYEQRLKEAKAKLYNHNRSGRRRIRRRAKVIDQEIADNWSMYQGDCVEVMKGLPSDSIHYSIFSPPFASLFTYSNSVRDMGNSTNKEFYDHFFYFIPELYRVMMPGRLVSFHCMNLPMTINTDGVIGMKDFRGKLISIFVD